MSRLVAAASALSLALVPSTAASAPVPFGARTISIAARGQPVREFLVDLFSQAGLRAKVSTAVTGKINGVFTGTPTELWNQLSRSYSLVMFYDGGTARIYHSSEVASRSFASADPKGVLNDANRSNMVGGVNTLQLGSGVVMASGVPAFLDRVEQLAGARMAAKAAPPPVAPSASIGGMTMTPAAILPPINRAPVARGTVKSEVMVPAGQRSPYEMRIFYLKYRSPSDEVRIGGGGGTNIPGMVTLLRELMGYGGPSQAPVTGGTNRVRLDNRGLETASDGYRGGRDDYGSRGDRARDRDGEESPPSRGSATLDGPRITADLVNKAVIVRDRPEVMGTYEAFIASADVEPLIVETQVTIVELNRSKLKDLGVDFALGIGGIRAVFGGDLLNGADAQGSYLRGRPDDYFARIRALEKNGAAQIVSRPVLTTPSNQEVLFSDLTTSSAPLIGEREVGVQNAEFGLDIRLTPSVIEDGGTLRVQMGVQISDTRFLGYNPSGLATYGGPTIATQVIVPSGESVLIAGMTQTTDFDYKSKTPVLGDIPVLGQAFRQRNKGTERREKLFLLTPHIITTQSADRPQPADAFVPIPLEQLQGKASTPVRATKPKRRR